MVVNIRHRLSGQLRPVDRVAVVYFLVTGVFAAVFGGMAGMGLAAGHGVIVWLVLCFAGSWRSREGVLGFLRVTWPVLLVPALYMELAVLNRFLSDRYFDATVRVWDEVLFGGQPSIFLSDIWPWVAFSEVIHLGYVGYYLIVPAAFVFALTTRGFEALERTAVAVTVAFFLCYLVFILFPVAGPRYDFPRIEGALSNGTIHGLVHTILEGGSSKGTAFPSSHIAASWAAVIQAGRENLGIGALLAVPAATLALGTVYGRFHYGVDALVGILFALAACWLVRRV